MTAWAALLALPVLSWAVFSIILNLTGLSKSLWQHALVSSLAGVSGSVLFLLAYLLLRSGDGMSDGYLALGIFVPLACIAVFPILALISKRFHKPLRLSALFAAAPGESEMTNISRRQEVKL
jgi:hypothetical protein